MFIQFSHTVICVNTPWNNYRNTQHIFITLNLENPSSNLGCCIETVASSLSHTNEYLAIDIGGYLCMNNNNYNMGEYYPEML